MNIVVIGAGMNVCGRKTEGYGTIMPAICEWKKNKSRGEVFVDIAAPMINMVMFLQKVSN